MPGTPTNEAMISAKPKSVPDILESTKNIISSSPTPSAKEKVEKNDSVDDHLFMPPMPGLYFLYVLARSL